MSKMTVRELIGYLISYLIQMPSDAYVVVPGRDHSYRYASMQSTEAIDVGQLGLPLSEYFGDLEAESEGFPKAKLVKVLVIS